MKSYRNIVLSVVEPLTYINLLGMAVGALSLISVSQWQVLRVGTFLVIFSQYIIPILMIPAGIFSHFMVMFQDSKQVKKEKLMFFLSIAYILSFISVWCIFIFWIVVSKISDVNLLISFIWANSAALFPLFLWAKKDKNNIFIISLVELAQVSLLIVSVLNITYKGMTFFDCLFSFLGFMISAVVLQGFFDKKSLFK